MENEKIVVGLDIGTTKICAIVGRKNEFGKLEVLAGVREFPVRVKCATLAWHTLHNALTGAADPAKTE